MLKQYGPDVPDATLQKLVAAFGELRSMADQGTITYPYSTREVVNIVKHLQVRRHDTYPSTEKHYFCFTIFSGLLEEILKLHLTFLAYLTLKDIKLI